MQVADVAHEMADVARIAVKPHDGEARPGRGHQPAVELDAIRGSKPHLLVSEPHGLRGCLEPALGKVERELLQP